MVYSTRRFVVCLTLCHFVLVFFSPFSIAITSLGEERANLSAFRTFDRFVLVWICRFPLPLAVWEGLLFVIVALPGLFSYLFYDFDFLYSHVFLFFIFRLEGFSSEASVGGARAWSYWLYLVLWYLFLCDGVCSCSDFNIFSVMKIKSDEVFAVDCIWYYDIYFCVMACVLFQILISSVSWK